MTNYKLHKLPKEGFIITSDEEINLKDKYLYSDQTKINTRLRQNPNAEYPYPEYKKVIAQQDQIDFTFLSEEDQKKIGWYNIEQLAHEVLIKWGIFSGSLHTGIRDGFVEGFQKAVELLSDRKFTLEEMRMCWLRGIKSYVSKGDVVFFEQFIKSIYLKWDIEIETESVIADYEPVGSDFPDHVEIPKLNNGKIKILKLL